MARPRPRAGKFRFRLGKARLIWQLTVPPRQSRWQNFEKLVTVTVTSALTCCRLGSLRPSHRGYSTAPELETQAALGQPVV